MKIVHVSTPQRKFGNITNSFAKKLNKGLIRLGHYICDFDDREIARSHGFFNSRLFSAKRTNNRFLEVCNNFRPQVVLLGHADIISNETIDRLRSMISGVKIAHWDMDDPTSRKPSYERIERFSESVDVTFLVVGGGLLEKFNKKNNCVAYIPNVVDRAIERFENDKKTLFDYDIVFCGSSEKGGQRDQFLRSFAEAPLLESVRIEVRGMFEKPRVYGDAYEQVLRCSKMGLNLSKVNNQPLMSSSRIAQLMGNGILTFISHATGLQEIITDDEAVFYDNFEDLIQKVLYYHENDTERCRIAYNGRIASHQRFSSDRIAKFMLEVIMEDEFSESYEWENHIFGR
jgi:spore maturation protein CgeB